LHVDTAAIGIAAVAALTVSLDINVIGDYRGSVNLRAGVAAGAADAAKDAIGADGVVEQAEGSPCHV